MGIPAKQTLGKPESRVLRKGPIVDALGDAARGRGMLDSTLLSSMPESEGSSISSSLCGQQLWHKMPLRHCNGARVF